MHFVTVVGHVVLRKLTISTFFERSSVRSTDSREYLQLEKTETGNVRCSVGALR